MPSSAHSLVTLTCRLSISSVGKSHLVLRIRRMFADESIIVLTSMRDKALI